MLHHNTERFWLIVYLLRLLLRIISTAAVTPAAHAMPSGSQLGLLLLFQ
jgi:hypothetical protein